MPKKAKAVELALNPDELRFRQVADLLPHMVWTANSQGECDFLSRHWADYTGVPTTEMLGQLWAQHLHPEDRANTFDVWKKSMATGADVQVAFRLRRHDGAYRWFDTRAVPLRDAQGKIVKWFGTNTDIQDAVEARRALAANEERLRYAGLATHDSVYDWDMRSGLTYRNEQFQRVFAAPAVARSSERWWEQHIHPDDRDGTVQGATRAFAAKLNSWSSEYRLMRADGSYAYVNDRAYLIYDAAQEPIRMIGAIADITERKLQEQTLRDARARLLSAIEGAAIATWVWDIAGGAFTWDDAAYQLWGQERASLGEITFAKTVELIHPDDRTGIQSDIEEFFRTGVDKVVEFRTVRPDGRLQWLQVRGRVDRNAEGAPVRMAGVYIDVTERKRIEQSLRDTQTRLQAAMQAAGLATWSWERATDTVIWDEHTLRLWGLPPDAPTCISTERFLEFVHPADRARIAEAIDAFVRNGVDAAVEFRSVRADGAIQWLTTRGHVEPDAQGKPQRAVGVYLDITERMQFEQTLRDAQDRLESAMAAGGLATWIWDLTNDALHWDAAAFRMWGLEPQQAPLSSTRVIELMHPEDQARIVARRSEFIGTLDDTDVEFRVPLPDGNIRWVLAKGRFTTDDQGRPIRMVGVYQDITERKHTEEARLVSQKMEALGTLAGGIAHDFNNLLLAITGNAKLALQDLAEGSGDTRALQRALQEIGMAGARAAELVRRILAFSRHHEAMRSQVALAPLVEEAVRLLRPTLPSHIHIAMRVAQRSPCATIDAIQFQQVVMNLVTNAAHAIGAQHGSITIELKDVSLNVESAQSYQVPVGRYAKLLVRDTGPGIDPVIVDRIFDPFFTTKKPGEGTGLGLAVVHGIVTAHGGAVTVKRSSDRGAQFEVLLPAADDAVDATRVHAVAVGNGAGHHVLYVDDEEALVFLIARVLERLGYRVTGSLDPVQALRLLKDRPQEFDVLVTDLSMHGMNGFELTREVRKIREDLPVILTSGYLRTEDRETAAECGIGELVLKPNTVDELGQSLDRVLKKLRESRRPR